MCRLTVLTKTTGLTDEMRLSLFWSTLILSQTDDAQHDGAGFSDGLFTAKTDLQFSEMSPALLGRLTPNMNWTGHVRKKSAGTSSGLLAAHPYEFNVKNRGKLVLCHNGYIRGTTAANDDAVNTDTYRVGRALAGLLENGASLTKELLETWISGFAYGSEWAFVIIFEGVTHIIRGQRTIWALNIGDGLGVLFNTSEYVIRSAKSLFRTLYPDIPMKNATLTAPHTLITIKPDGTISTTPYAFVEKDRPASPPYLWTSDDKGEIKTFA